MQKVYGLARVSTVHQNEERQVQALLEYGIDIHDIIIEKESGKNFERSGYLFLKNNLLRPGDEIVVKELDRLGRNKAMVKAELEWFKDHGIRVKILDVPTTLIDCGDQDWVLDMVSNILIEVLSSVASAERDKIHQRQAEGIAVAREKGVVFGRPCVAKPENFEAIMELVDSGQITAVKAMAELGVKKTTYYKLRQTYWQAADRA